MSLDEQRSSSIVVNTDRPYRASWLNHLLDWIESRPGPAWPYYLIGFILIGLIETVARWLHSEISVGEIDAEPFIGAVYPTYFVALMHYLGGEARSALAKFRPLLQVDDAEYFRLEYKLSTAPARGAWIATVLAIIAGIAITLDYEARLGRPNEVASFTLTAILTIFSVASFFILNYHTVRQLRLVSQLHAAATDINLFQPWPAYAFSQLTARAGMGLIFFTYLNWVLVRPPVITFLVIVITGIPLLVAILALLLPLLGMQQRLVREKIRLASEVNEGVEIAHKALQEHVHSRNFADVADLDNVLSSLLSLRAVVANLPTWPWHPETLRGFISALLIPLLLWVLTRILERLVVF